MYQWQLSKTRFLFYYKHVSRGTAALSMMIVYKLVRAHLFNIGIACYDTKHPTYAPSVAPTTPAPTLAPTEICESIRMHVTGTDAVKTYDGVYNKQSSTINGYDWWIARNDVGATDASANATIYFSTSHNRWVIEAPDVYWEANITAHSVGLVDDAHLNKEDPPPIRRIECLLRREQLVPVQHELSEHYGYCHHLMFRHQTSNLCSEYRTNHSGSNTRTD